MQLATRILFVDDDDLTRQAFTFDAILLDLSLPDARGLDAVDRVRRAAPDTVLIVLSGIPDERLALHAVQLGAQDYLNKDDCDAGALWRSLRHATVRKRAEVHWHRDVS